MIHMHADQDWLAHESAEGILRAFGTSSCEVCIGLCPDTSYMDRTVRFKSTGPGRQKFLLYNYTGSLTYTIARIEVGRVYLL